MQESAIYLSRKQVGKLLGLSLRGVDRLRKAGELKGFLIGHRRLFEFSEVRALVARLREREGGHHA